jgi:hypothetical protein
MQTLTFWRRQNESLCDWPARPVNHVYYTNSQGPFISKYCDHPSNIYKDTCVSPSYEINLRPTHEVKVPDKGVSPLSPYYDLPLLSNMIDTIVGNPFLTTIREKLFPLDSHPRVTQICCSACHKLNTSIVFMGTFTSRPLWWIKSTAPEKVFSPAKFSGGQRRSKKAIIIPTCSG